MALNGAHAGKGVLLYAGECIILYADNVVMEFEGNIPALMKGSKTGRLYLTTHRMIFNNKSNKDPLQSFATPFFCLKKVQLEQPVFGANYIKGYVKAQTNGGFTGEAKFSLTFKHGGAIEYGQALLKVASMATQNINQQWREAPPPYTPPSGPWANAPPPAYAPPQAGYYGWVPPTKTFPERPPADSVFMYEAPPPYPGVAAPYPGVAAPYPGVAAPYPGVAAPYPGVTAPYPGVTAPYPGVTPPPPYPGVAPQSGYMAQNGYPVGQPPAAAATGFSVPPSNPKAQEASQSAYYDPNNPQYAYVPPPAYTPTAPSYEETMKKTN